MWNAWRWEAWKFFLCAAAVGVMGLRAAMAGAGAIGLEPLERLLIFLGGLAVLLWGLLLEEGEGVRLALLPGCAVLLVGGLSILHVVWRARRDKPRNNGRKS